MEFKAIAHLAFKVADMEKSLDFYCNKLGLRRVFTITYGDLAARTGHVWPGTEDMQDVPWTTYIEFAPQQFVELFTARPEMEHGVYDDDHIGYLHFALQVEDIEAAQAELEARGVEIVTPPRKGASGSIQLWIADPDGNRIELMQYTPDSMQLL